MTDISFVIPMIREYPAVLFTVNSIEAEMVNTGLNYEIILVENGEVDDFTERFKQFYRIPLKMGLIKYDFEPRQCGPAARMKGANMAKGKYVMFMDAHSNLGKNSIRMIIEEFENYDMGIAHGTIVKTHYVKHKGAHYRLFGNRGPNLNSHFHGSYSKTISETPYKCIVANLAYTLFNRKELFDLRGYHPKCQYYPHPEGYLPLKYAMFGRQPWIVPEAYHFHNVWRNPGAQGRQVWTIPIGEETYGMVGVDHLITNAMMCAYTLGGDKWLKIVYDTWFQKVRSKWVLNGIRDYAKSEAEEEYNWVQNNMEKTLDEVLIEARKNKIAGMENWLPEIGPDPLGLHAHTEVESQKEKGSAKKITKLEYVDSMGNLLWEAPMLFNKLWASGDWILHNNIRYDVLGSVLSGSIQRVTVIRHKEKET